MENEENSGMESDEGSTSTESDEAGIYMVNMSNIGGKVIGKVRRKSDHEIEWKIKDFFSYTDAECYCSSCLEISELGYWFLKILTVRKRQPEWISLHLCRDVGDGVVLSEGVCYTFGVKKKDGTVEQFFAPAISMFDEDCSQAGYNEFLEKSMLLQRRSEIVPSDTLTLTCTWWTTERLVWHGDFDRLSRDLVDLYTSKRGSDATLKVKGKAFSVHKSILSARSSVFAAMFENDMKEKKTGIVQIPDCDPDAFGEFLMYLYSGKIPEGSCNLFELYKIADKYDLSALKSYCRMSILKKLTPKNVLDAILLGRQFDEHLIHLRAQKCFKQHFPEIRSTPDWEKFLKENEAVASELLSESSPKGSAVKRKREK